MINIIYITYKDLSREDIVSFWDQGISMDDWDYMILLPKDTPRIKGKPADFDLEKLLKGAYQNIWKIGNFRGNKYLIGIAYHS